MSATRASSRPFVSGSFARNILIIAFAVLVAISATAQTPASPQALAPEPLITQPVDESQLTTLTGNTHPLARPEFDLGTAPASLPMERMLLVLKRSPQQEAALRTLLDNQQDKHSSSYHQWLTPDQFGKQFGPTDQDMATITAWLQSHGFQVGSTHGRTVLEFSGSASQVQEAFHTAIHKYVVNGEQHWANASDPSIPTALTPAVAGVASMNNFPRKPMNVQAGVLKLDRATGKVYSENPQVTQPGQCTPVNECYGLGPYDFATIYNLAPLWSAGIDGTGVTIAIVGETDIQMSDVQAFRSNFGLPANDPVFILNGPDPGIQTDETEADLDVQWSGGVAKGATVDFVISQSTETTFGTDLSAVYIVEQNLAPIMSESYGQCELALGTAGNQFYDVLWQQASAEGITVFVSAGDAGSAGCDDFDAESPAPARYGLQVSGYASTPYNVAVGGTDFNDFDNSTTYWSDSNNPTTLQSALSYIPETTWNDSCTNALFATIGFSSNPEANCNNSQLIPYFDVPVAGSGGSSACTTPNGNTPSSCAGGYTRPSWQTGSGSFSPDGHRDLPDVSLFASPGFVGEIYLICQADAQAYCQPGTLEFGGVGGTSASSPAFAGIMALINQQTGERQGNANYVFYKLAQKSGASCTSSASEASSCIFNDVTVGTNAGPCATGSPNCVTNTGGDSYGVLSGYNAGAGYDMATGLGSVNAYNLVKQWNSVATLASATTLTPVSSTTLTHGQAFQFSAAVKPESGTGATPTGTVSLIGPATQFQTSQGIAGFNLSSGTVSGSTDLLPGGSYQLTAHYSGDANYAASDSGPISVNVGKENSEPQVFLVTFNAQNQVISGDTNTAVYGSPYILRVNVENSSGQMCNPVSTSNATGCPSGNVVMTDNGSSLDAGTFALNSYGYFEDWSVQLPGGTNNVKAAYAGDNSFDANSVTSPITITQAGTSIATPTTVGVGPWVGSTLYENTAVTAKSSGIAPSGTVTFFANGKAMAGTVSYSGTAGSGSPPTASLSAGFESSVSPFTAPGTYSISASYSGDSNYASSTSGVVDLMVQYQQPSVTLSPFTQNVPLGSTATVTAVVDTTNKSNYPTGTVTFVNLSNNQSLGTPVACTNAKDSNGNFECQAIFTFTPAGGTTVLSANYSGDQNYPNASSGAVSVSVPDFSLNPNPASIMVTQGQVQTLMISVADLAGFSGTVGNFTCSGLPVETSCSFNPTQVTGQGATTLTITTTPLGQTVPARRATVRRASLDAPCTGWLASMMLPFLGLSFVGIATRRKKSMLPWLLVIALAGTALSCGGGGGGGGQQSNPVPSISSLSPTQQAAGSQSQTLTINGSNFITNSTVTYNGVAHTATYVNSSQLYISLSQGDMATAGSYSVVVSNPAPGGGASSPTNFTVTTGTPVGNFIVTIGASSGSLTHTTTFQLTVQ
ncbi:MAG TPA: Ig-like domain repeat protein [Verrucomicrobiae bacterium]|nr:Ig-like domain repeat protein [Verrucomicrobiae bacterium]